MRLVHIFSFLSVILTTSIFCVQFSPKPVAVYKTPDSIMDSISPIWAQKVGNRLRYSTCTGVAWFADNTHLVSANLLDNSLQTYRFNQDRHVLQVDQKYSDDITQLSWPENLTISRDGTLLAVSNSATGRVCVYRINPENGQLSASPIAFIEAGDLRLHGVRFSPDGNFLAYVTYDDIEKIRIFRLSDPLNGSISFDLKDTVENKFEGLAPKGIDFSHDMNFVAICYSARAGTNLQLQTGKLAIFKFDSKTGKLSQKPLWEIGINEYLHTPEDVLFYIDDSFLLVSNQGNDTITAHSFDRTTGLTSKTRVILSASQGELNFPHGITISSDGKYLAVSNYGDDKVSIYSIEP